MRREQGYLGEVGEGQAKCAWRNLTRWRVGLPSGRAPGRGRGLGAGTVSVSAEVGSPGGREQTLAVIHAACRREPHPDAGGSRGAHRADLAATRGGKSCRLLPLAEPGPHGGYAGSPGLRRLSTDPWSPAGFPAPLRKVNRWLHFGETCLWARGTLGPDNGGGRGGRTSMGPGALRPRTAIEGARTKPTLKSQTRKSV